MISSALPKRSVSAPLIYVTMSLRATSSFSAARKLWHPSHSMRREERCLRSSGGRRAVELREAYRGKVTRNVVRVDQLWARPCRAYNVQIELDFLERRLGTEIQQCLKEAETNLLVCPPKSLHVSVAWLLAVHASYPVPKDALWERHGGTWTTGLNRIAAQSAGFRIAYEHVVATDSAVVALAEPTEPVNRIRGMICERLRLPPETRNEADLVHTTLFRYRGPLSDPEKFLAVLEDTSAAAAAEVDELVISRELVYPSLEAEVLARLPLAHRQAHHQASTLG